MSFKKAFLPAGLVLAIVAALVLPGPGVWMEGAHMISLFVVVIFFINGWQFKLTDAKLGGKFGAAFCLSAALSLLGGPFLGLLATKLFPTDAAMDLGLIVIASAPVTLSTAIVLTEISHGNRAWALLMTIGINLLGIFTMPFMLEFILKEAEGVEISASALLIKLLLLVLTPFAAGALLRRLAENWATPSFVSYLPSTCVILTVYAGFAVARDTMTAISWVSYPVITVASFFIHLILMGLALTAARILSLEKAETKTMLFITSQKTLPLAISVIVVIAPEAALALVPCLLFHFLQLFFHSFVASHMSPKHT